MLFRSHEHDVLQYATRALAGVPGLRQLGTARDRTSILSFTLGDVHAHDVGTILDRRGIAVRSGHHCAQPLMARLGVPATVRASFACHSTRREVDALVEALADVREILG